ncbi:MAG: T9SS type A sorting domain-containing protein [Flavobacteriia bacterium]|nr:T9SS type A sorting domain-containing protein [Flavobacteriia bacterium]
MKTITFFFLISLSSLSFSQTWNIGQQMCIGGSLDENIQGSLKLSNGNFLIYGTSKSGISGDKTEPNLGNTDIWLVELDQNLQVVWQKTLGGYFLDGANKIIESSNNELYILATSASGISATKSENCYGNNDIWVLKMDLNGNILWDKTLGGDLYELAIDILELESGNILISGQSNSNQTGNKTAPLIGFNDIWIIKITPNGTIQYDKTIGGTGDESSGLMTKINQNEILITCSSNSNISGNKTENSYGSSDFWLLKIDTLANVLLDKTIGGTGYEINMKISRLYNGNSLISCTSNSPLSGLKTDDNYGSSDTWILEIDENFNIIRQKTVGSNKIDAVCFTKQLLNNQIIVGMISDSDVNLYKSEPRIGTSNKDQWFVVLDGNFNKISDKTIGTTGNEDLSNIIETSNNNFLIFGASNGALNNDKTCAGNGSSDYWIYKLDTNLGLDEILTSNINAFPNPVKQELTIETEMAIDAIEIQNLEGKVVATFNQMDQLKTINVQNLITGIYLCKIKMITGQIEVIRFVKE